MRLDPQVKERLKKTFSEEIVAQKGLVSVISAYQLSSEELKKIVLELERIFKKANLLI